MKILMISTYYPQLLEDFYLSNPETALESHDVQTKRIFKTCGGLHRYPLELSEAGWETQLFVPNNFHSQLRWCAEQGVSFPRTKDWQSQLLRKQIEQYQPDIIHCMDPISYDSEFFRSVSYKPQVLVGWRSAWIPPETDFSSFDLILSSDMGCLEKAKRQGARRGKILHPAFPLDYYEAVKTIVPEVDVVFTGQWTDEHKVRNQMLLDVAKAPLGTHGELEIEYFLQTGSPQTLPAGVSMLNRGPVWTTDMFRTLRRGKVVLNAIIDHAAVPAFNLRFFECLGVGAFQLTPHTSAIEEFFKIGSEVVTYSSTEDLIQKIYYYKNHPEERNEIAKRGRERCHKEHSSRVRAAQYLELIQQIV